MSQINRRRHQELQHPKQEEVQNHHHETETETETETEEQVAHENQNPVMAAIGHAMPRSGERSGQVQRWTDFLHKVPGKSTQHSLLSSLQSNYGNQFTASVARIYQQTQSPTVIQRVKIRGYTLSQHGSERRDRKDIDTRISRSTIENTIVKGTRYRDEVTGALVFYHGDVAVVTQDKTIVTVYRTPEPNTPKQRWVEL